MIFVAKRDTKEVLNKCDAWEYRGEERMIAWAKHNGYKPLESEITRMGDMIIWVD